MPTSRCSRPELLAQLGVEIRQGLVEKEKAGVEDQGTGQGDPLLLAPGESAGVLVTEPGQPDHGEHFLDAGADLRSRPLPYLEGVGHVLRHRHVGPDRVRLEDQAYVPPFGRHDDPVGGRGHGLAVDGDEPGLGLLETRDAAQGRCLPAPAWSEQGQNLPPLHSEGDPGHGCLAAEALAEPLDEEVVGHLKTDRDG
jgi:hypothetical protein